MKLRVISVIALVAIAASTPINMNAQGTYSSTFTINGAVPDGNAVGLSDTRTSSLADVSTLRDLTVSLNIVGGFNGDLYAYLSHDGVLVPLLNRIGVTDGNPFGSGGSGMNVTLADGNTDIHQVGDQSLSGVYSPDGRNVSPLSAPAAFDTAERIPLGAFDGMDPNGQWTLFVSDMSSGGISFLDSWGMSFTGGCSGSSIPEPTSSTLTVFLGSLLGLRKLCRKG